jgi:chorismate mutase
MTTISEIDRQIAELITKRAELEKAWPKVGDK